MKFKEISSEIKKIVTLYDDEFFSDESDNSIWMVLDRGPRIDHGGGPDGDDWLDDDQLNSIREEYYQNNKHKIDKIKNFLDKNNISSRVMWEYGEKGHFSIDVRINI